MMKFNYGDAVRVNSIDAAVRYGIESGSVCGFREITCEVGVQQHALLPREKVLILVEGNTGNAVEIPEGFLELM